MQSRWGTQGDYSAIVLSPNSVQEMSELTVRAFNLAEKYRTPVILLADEVVAHMREKIVLPSTRSIEIIDRKKPKQGEKAFFGLAEVPPMPSLGEGLNVAVTGSTHDAYGIRFTADPTVHKQLVERLNNKIQGHSEEIADVETYRTKDCQVGIVSFGCTSRAIYEAVESAEARGLRVGYVRLKTLWPFPEKSVRQLAEKAERIIVPEMNLKQIFYEVQRVAGGSAEVIPLNKIGGGELITPEELLEKILDGMKNG
jgi:2-oxoglutarate ferredoxin oxidoreductase subunit alpha